MFALEMEKVALLDTSQKHTHKYEQFFSIFDFLLHRMIFSKNSRYLNLNVDQKGLVLRKARLFLFLEPFFRFYTSHVFLGMACWIFANTMVRFPLSDGHLFRFSLAVFTFKKVDYIFRESYCVVAIETRSLPKLNRHS